MGSFECPVMEISFQLFNWRLIEPHTSSKTGMAAATLRAFEAIPEELLTARGALASYSSFFPRPLQSTAHCVRGTVLGSL